MAKKSPAHSSRKPAAKVPANAAKPPPAYFLSLTVENVRCFKGPETLDLSDGNGRPAPWTILLGDNGTGKTTLLQCLANLQPVSADIYKEPERLIPWIATKSVSQTTLLERASTDFPANLKAQLVTHLSALDGEASERVWIGFEVSNAGRHINLTAFPPSLASAYNELKGIELICYRPYSP